MLTFSLGGARVFICVRLRSMGRQAIEVRANRERYA
jgi:hypothetical protein